MFSMETAFAAIISAHRSCSVGHYQRRLSEPSTRDGEQIKGRVVIDTALPRAQREGEVAVKQPVQPSAKRLATVLERCRPLVPRARRRRVSHVPDAVA